MEDDNKSILDQIMTNHQAEEATRLDAVEIITNLFSELDDRARDVLIRRFGLAPGGGKEILEQIGKIHKLTRERIRQIETASIKKLRRPENLDSHLSGLKNIISNLLEEHGGFMEKEYLFSNLVNFSVGGGKNSQDEIKHKRHFDFLIAKLLSDEFEVISDSEYFKEFFKLKYQSLEHLEALAKELLEKIQEIKKIFRTEELVNLAKELLAYKNNQEKFSLAGSLNVSDILANDLFKEPADIINGNKVIYSILRAAKKIEQNKFGLWGISDWPEIRPKTVNDKIYLILKNNGQPMHFVGIADKIDQISFDGKKANAATVHNELILDEKYILVGRGLYGLKEWGYQKGTVAEVVEKIVAESAQSLNREEIISKVLAQRAVKRSTINLALMNKNKFDITSDGKYSLKQSF
ncbi:MAG: hypothetical protein HYV53_03610 [Parcubacteria group bacterium]|nr:hypothetical protein [Parcubacteria group bacterium]